MEEVLVVVAAVAAIIFEMWSMKRTESALLVFKDEIRKQENAIHELRYETLVNMKELERGMSVMQALQSSQSIMFEAPTQDGGNE